MANSAVGGHFGFGAAKKFPHTFEMGMGAQILIYPLQMTNPQRNQICLSTVTEVPEMTLLLCVSFTYEICINNKTIKCITSQCTRNCTLGSSIKDVRNGERGGWAKADNSGRGGYGLCGRPQNLRYRERLYMLYIDYICL